MVCPKNPGFPLQKSYDRLGWDLDHQSYEKSGWGDGTLRGFMVKVENPSHAYLCLASFKGSCFGVGGVECHETFESALELFDFIFLSSFVLVSYSRT